MDDSIIEHNTKTQRINQSIPSQQMDKKSMCLKIQNHSRISTKLSILREPNDFTDKKELVRLKSNLKQQASEYIQKRMKHILKSEVQKLKLKDHLQKIIEDYKNPLKKENIRIRHHEKIESKLKKFREQEASQEIQKLENYLKKKKQIETKVQKFLKQKQLQSTRISRRRIMTQERNDKNSISQKIIQKDSINRKKITKRSHSVIFDETKKYVDRKTLQELQERKQVMNKYMTKMKKAQERLISLEIKKYNEFKLKKQRPVKPYIQIRQHSIQSKRENCQKELNQKFNTFSKNFNEYKNSRQSLLKSKSQLQELKKMKVQQKKQALIQQNTNRNNLQYDLKKEKHQQKFIKKSMTEKLFNYKKIFQLKKQKQKNQFLSTIRKLQTKIIQLESLNSRENVPNKIINQTFNLINSLTDNDFKSVQFAQKNKCEFTNDLLSKSKSKLLESNLRS